VKRAPCKEKKRKEKFNVLFIWLESNNEKVQCSKLTLFHSFLINFIDETFDILNYLIIVCSSRLTEGSLMVFCEWRLILLLELGISCVKYFLDIMVLCDDKLKVIFLLYDYAGVLW
jgi:hypothetical protein